MKLSSRIFAVSAALLLVAVSSAQAQGGKRALRLGGSRPDSARREAMRQRLASLTPEQRARVQAHMEAARVERETVAAKVKSGQMTRAQARAELQAWQKTNRPKLRGMRNRFRA